LKKSLRISLKSGDRIYVNGAVLRVDRKVSFEFLNDVRFLLEAHFMRPEMTTTPLRQIYYYIQTMLIEPAAADAAHALYREAMLSMAETVTSEVLLRGLQMVACSVETERHYDALRALRGLFAAEQSIIDGFSRAATDAALVQLQP